MLTSVGKRVPTWMDRYTLHLHNPNPNLWMNKLEQAVNGALERLGKGDATLRPSQRACVEAVVERKRVIASLRAGGGKTLMFTASSLTLPALKDASQAALVATPLRSLISQQLQELPSSVAEALDKERRAAQGVMQSKDLCLIYTCPETLCENESVLKALEDNQLLRLIVVDEARLCVTTEEELRPC